jgi:hypothetical protein
MYLHSVTYVLKLAGFNTFGNSMENSHYFLFELFISLRNVIFWVINPCRPSEVHTRFRGTGRLHFSVEM